MDEIAKLQTLQDAGPFVSKHLQLVRDNGDLMIAQLQLQVHSDVIPALTGLVKVRTDKGPRERSPFFFFFVLNNAERARSDRSGRAGPQQRECEDRDHCLSDTSGRTDQADVFVR